MARHAISLLSAGLSAGSWRGGEDVWQIFALEREEGIILLEVKGHIVVVLVIYVQLGEDGLHHPPVEGALCHVLHHPRAQLRSNLRMASMQRPLTDVSRRPLKLNLQH